MLINLKVKTLDAQTHEFSIDNELTVKDFKDKVAEKTNIAADQQRIIYCGRVMVDDKQLKEYDVDGKVVHVAERPPPSQRLPSSDNSGSNANPPNERRARGRTGAGGMRNSPLFRALDGMVVGTMAFPMNANTNGQAAVNPFAASSSFCMNRITVARHMLDCANNIAAYLEDPSRGLNNQSLDILARGRWTMESTVVEVGITSDIPQSQQIVEMVQGAVQAALRNSGNTNVTLVQLPTVYSSNENEGNNAAATTIGGAITDATAAPAVEENSSTAAATVLIDDIIDDDEDTPTNEQSNNNSTAASPTSAAASAVLDESAAASNNDDGSTDNSRRRTGTPVLAAVIEQMRNVQTRLNPFIDQYHDLLQNEQVFEENDNDGRLNAQRLFDRVSEAFHYMSHAQHAISDLMLDVSQGSPRYLTCRPILVEQSGYVSSNNFLTPAMIPALRQHQQQQQQQQQQQPRLTTNNTGSATTTSATAAVTNSNNATASAAGSSRSNSISGSSTSSSNANSSTVDDPIDDPVTWPPTLNLSGPENDNITNSNTNASVGRASSTTNNPARVTTATLPTTSTQTRSTSRPQVHFGNIPVLGMPPGWNGRVLPNNNVSSFDRFLPCNSHHISEPENANNSANNENGSNANAATSSAPPNPEIPGIANIVTRRPLQRMRAPSSRIVGSTMTTAPRVANTDTQRGTNTDNVEHPSLPFMVMREMFIHGVPTAEVTNNPTSSSSASSSLDPELFNQDALRRNLHKQLKHCLNNHIFEGKPINDDTIPPAINRTIKWFGESLLYLPQYEKPEYDSRGSLFNILRSTLPLFIELLQRNYVDFKEFELKLKQICEQFRKRLYSVLYVCVGRDNAEIFWGQLMRLLCNSLQTNLNGDIAEFLGIYLTTNIPSATDEIDAEQFLILRTFSSINSINNVQMPMDTDVEMTESTATTASQPDIEDNEPLPSVIPDSAPWHRNFPNDWLPIITRDIQRQTENPINQPPYSDAYISGMSSKRRKLVQNSKPPTEIGALIADSVNKAIQSSGLGTSSSSNQIQTPEDIARAIGSDAAVQSSCSDVVRSNVRERLKKDPDFEADKFPKSKKFMQK